MSIADEIQRIKDNIKKAYSICSNKGATLPTKQNSDNLFSTINTISVNSSNATKYGITVDNFLGEVDAEGKIKVPVAGDLNAKGVVRVENYTLACKFGGSAYGTSREQGLRSIVFPDLTYIGNAAMYCFCTYSTDLERVEFPELEEIGQCGMEEGFTHNSKLKSISFPKLKRLTGMYSSLESVCDWCQKLETVNFDSLESLTSKALYCAFKSCISLKTLSFPSLKIDSFGNYTNQFDSMLSGVRNCTVHFPYCVKDVIKDWQSILTGFGGKNTIIVFDLHTATLNFLTNKSSCKFSINNRVITGTTGYAEPETLKYSCYDSSTNTLFVETLHDLKADVTYDINIDEKFSSLNKNKITISTGISGLEVYFKVCGQTIKALEEAKGIYSINVSSNNDEFTYFVDGGNNYTDVEGSFTSNGQDITIPLTLNIATYADFVRPNLTANGIMGGDDFAVAEEDIWSSSYAAYHAFSGSLSDYCWLMSSSPSITFYNPKPLKISKLVLSYIGNSTTYQAKNTIVQGSNDNATWTDLAEVGYEAGSSRTINVNSAKGYKYYKLKFTVYSTYIRISDIEITAQYKE